MYGIVCSVVNAGFEPVQKCGFVRVRAAPAPGPAVVINPYFKPAPGPLLFILNPDPPCRNPYEVRV